MEAVYQWAGRIVSYLVFITVLTGLLPAARYEKYLRLFSGCILILLVFQPLTGGLRLEESIRRLFGTITFENEARELGEQQDEMGKKRLALFLSEYETETEAEIRQLAEASGVLVEEAKVWVETEESSPEFGRIRRILLECKPTEGETPMEGTEAAGAISVDAVEEIELSPVAVGGKKRGSAGNGGGEADRDTEAVPAHAAAASRSEQRAIENLRRQLASYYQVEEAYVEIRMEAGEKTGMGQGEMAPSSD